MNSPISITNKATSTTPSTKGKVEAKKFCPYTYVKWIGTTRCRALGIEDYFGALLLFRETLLARNRFYSLCHPGKTCFPILPLRGSVAQGRNNRKTDGARRQIRQLHPL